MDLGDRELRPPQNSEIEITVLGRGYGESIVIHMGDKNWIVVDSFTCGGIVGPLDYLGRMGIGPECIRVILASHWHDDHVRGLAKLYRAAVDADIAFSIALREDEFAAFVRDTGSGSFGVFSSGVTELLEINKINKQDRRRDFRLISASSILFVSHRKDTTFAKTCEFVALSPSPGDVVDFIRSLAPEPSPNAARLPTQRNPASVVGWVSVGDSAALLGADLEQTNDSRTGWSAIVNSRVLPSRKAQIFKVPHHGSITGHNAQVWATMVEGGAIAALAPWQLGRSLPKDSDIIRIKDLAGVLYTAREGKAATYKAKSSAVNKMLKSGGAKLTTIPNEYGYVQMRRDVTVGGEWSVKLDGGAKML